MVDETQARRRPERPSHSSYRPGMSLALTRHPSLLARAIVKLEQFCIQNIEKDIAVI